jgi:hypothetical protein
MRNLLISYADSPIIFAPQKRRDRTASGFFSSGSAGTVPLLMNWSEHKARSAMPMAYERDPTDPFRPAAGQEPLRDARSLDNELQADPELAEGPASGTRIALYAVAAAVILGAVFYGLNNSETTTATTGANTPTAQTTAPQSTPKTDRNVAEQSKPPVAPGVRDVTPSNSQPGTTTGSAPAAQPQSASPPASDGSRVKE